MIIYKPCPVCRKQHSAILGCLPRKATPISPWVRNAIAGTLPASDRTGTVRA